VIEKVIEMVSKGATTEQIAEAFGMSKRTFLRKKKADSALGEAYSNALTSRRGAFVQKDNYIVQPIDMTQPDPAELVVNLVRSNPGATFHEIRKAARMGEDELAGVLPQLMLDTRRVYAIRDPKGDHFRYYVYAGRGIGNEQQRQSYSGFDGRSAAGFAVGAG
jgi:predicted DNA-binding transcriptional regulator YafY